MVDKTSQNLKQKIWAVGSGKGGVGKSLFATNLAVMLANLGKSVAAVDLDLGNANMHTCLGIKYPRKTLTDFFNGLTPDLNEILLDTPIYNLKFISGAGGILGSANPWHTQRQKLSRYLERLPMDSIVLDLGAGTSYNTIDFFLNASERIVITTPESTAIQSAYNFIRICVFRQLQYVFYTNKTAWSIIEKAKIPNPDGEIIKIRDLLEFLSRIDKSGVERFKALQQDFNPMLVINMVMKSSETKIGWGIREVVKNYLDTEINYVGCISFDPSVRESLHSDAPFLMNSPKSKAAGDIMSLLPKLMGYSSDGDYYRETVVREIRQSAKSYSNRIVEGRDMNVDPSIYAVDKVRRGSDKNEQMSAPIFSPASWSKIAIDLGTSNTLIYVKGRGIIFNEPSLISVDETNGKIVAIGNESKAMTGRAHSGIRVISPLESGAITDYTDVKRMIQEFVKRAKKSTILIRPGVLMTINPGLTSVEKKAFKDFIKELGAREIHLVYEPLASAIGAGLPVDIPKASMLVSIGGGSVSAILVSISGIVGMSSERVGGKVIDNHIIRYLRDTHNFYIGNQTAEWIKINHGQATKIERDKQFEIRGQDVSMGIPKTLMISTSEIREAISKPVKRIIKVIMDLLENIPPELSGDLVDRGMTLTGGGAFLKGLDKLITDKTGIKVRIAPNALTATIEGVGRMLDDFNKYQRFFIEETDLQ